MKFQTGQAPNHAISLGCKWWADELMKRTNNRVKVNMFYGEPLGKVGTHYDMVLGGTVDVAYAGYTQKPGAFPLGEVFSYLVGIPSAVDAARAHWELYKKGYFDKELTAIKPLFMLTGPPQYYMTSKPVRVVEDFKGMKIRAMGPLAPLTEKFGAIPITITSGETYSALEKGLVQGTLNNYASIYSGKVHEVLKYLLDVSLGTWSGVTPMNLNTWKALPPDIQKVIDGLQQEATIAFSKAYDDESVPAKKAFADAKVQIYTPPPAERQRFEAIGQAYLKEWASDMEKKGLPANKLLQELYPLPSQTK